MDPENQAKMCAYRSYFQQAYSREMPREKHLLCLAKTLSAAENRGDALRLAFVVVDEHWWPAGLGCVCTTQKVSHRQI